MPTSSPGGGAGVVVVVVAGGEALVAGGVDAPPSEPPPPQPASRSAATRAAARIGVERGKVNRSCPGRLEKMSTYELVADLPLRIDDYALEGMQEDVSTGFTRKSTVIHLAGGGEEGVGEDVTYDAVDHEIAWKAGPSLALAGDWTIASFAEHLATLDPFPEEPQRDVSR